MFTYLQCFKKYFVFFYIFGQNPYISFDHRKKKKIPSILCWLPLLIALFLSLLSLFMLYQYMFSIDGKFQWRSTTTVGILAFEVYTNSLFIIFEHICHQKSEHQILSSFDVVIDDFQQSLDTIVQLKKFEKKFFRKFIFTILMLCTSCIFRFLYPDQMAKTFVPLRLMFFYETFCMLHVLLFIDLNKFMLRTLSKKLESVSNSNVACISSSKRLKPRDFIRILHRTKMTHFKVYQIRNHIHKRFGWFLTIFILESVSAIVFIIFGTFTHIISKGGSSSDFGIMRNYNF